MHAMVLREPGTALEWTELPDRLPGPGEIRITVGACGVCRTDLHVVDGELPDAKLPIIPGHEIVGRIDALGSGVDTLRIGERVGIPWLARTCGVCPCSPGTHATAVTRRPRSLTRAMRSRWERMAATRNLHRCFAPASSAGVRW